MNRKQFIISHGATCKNWTWSWSFVNETERCVIFGAWDMWNDGQSALILAEKWERTKKGRKSTSYPQSREHIGLVEEEGFRLMTFPMKYSNELQDEDGSGPGKIGGFEPILTEKILFRRGSEWYAEDPNAVQPLAEELAEKKRYSEGAAHEIRVNAYERSVEARRACIRIHGCSCVVCGFNFEAQYGEIGEGFIHVHHCIPLASITSGYEVDPETDLVPVCPNCHAMIHRKRDFTMPVEDLRSILNVRRK